jgi:hypothetical protein
MYVVLWEHLGLLGPNVFQRPQNNTGMWHIFWHHFLNTSPFIRKQIPFNQKDTATLYTANHKYGEWEANTLLTAVH